MINEWYLRSHAYNTQIMQAEALGWAYRSWRREWRGKGKEFVRVISRRVSPRLMASIDRRSACLATE